MKKAFIDTNVWLRFFLNDNAALSEKARKIIAGAKDGNHILITDSAMLLELAWVLFSFYKQKKEETINILNKILAAFYVEVLDKETAKQMTEYYSQHNMDIIDCYLLSQMSRQNIKEVFSFDRDFDKIKTIKRREA